MVDGLNTNSKNKILNLLIIIVSLIVAYYLYKGQTERTAFLKNNISLEKQKNIILSGVVDSGKAIDRYKAYLDKKDISTVINTLNNLAKEAQVKIDSLKPVSKEDSATYVKYPFELSLTSDSYHKIGNFVSLIEKHPDVYSVESLEIRSAGRLSGPSSRSTMLAGTEEEKPERQLSFNLKISTLLTK